MADVVDEPGWLFDAEVLPRGAGCLPSLVRGVLGSSLSSAPSVGAFALRVLMSLRRRTSVSDAA